jgi:hypothetical protein
MSQPTNSQLTKKMIEYAKAHKLKVPWPLVIGSNVWGNGKATLAYRVSKHINESNSKFPVASYRTPRLTSFFFPAPPGVHIIHKTYNWAYSLQRRGASPLGVVWHNMGGNGTADGIHAYHKSLGWAGIAYHFFVDKEGRVYQGRPEWALGGHTLNASAWLGICFEGNYETVDKVMPPKQLEAGKALHAYLDKKYGNIPDKRHKDMPGNSTGCPGVHFPFGELVQ